MYGDFCWSGDKTRAEAYFIPAGTKPTAQHQQPRPRRRARRRCSSCRPSTCSARRSRAGDGVRDVQRARRRQGARRRGRQHGGARSSSTTTRRTGRRRIDEQDGALAQGDEEAALAGRSSRGSRAWLVVIVLLVMVLLRGGGGRQEARRRRPAGAAPPGLRRRRRAATATAAGYGASARPGYGMQRGEPTARGDGRRAAAGRRADRRRSRSSRHAPQPPPGATPLSAGPRARARRRATGRAGALPRVRDEHDGDARAALGLLLVRAAAAARRCTKGGGGARCSRVSPYRRHERAAARAPAEPIRSGRRSAASAATLRGAAGQFTIRPGAEVRVGRDPAQCPIFLSEPRVSGVHATLKLRRRAAPRARRDVEQRHVGRRERASRRARGPGAGRAPAALRARRVQRPARSVSRDVGR